MCPHCRSIESKVLQTRRDNEDIYRQRRCLGCGEKYVSCEIAPLGMVMPDSFLQEQRERLDSIKPRKRRSSKKG